MDMTPASARRLLSVCVAGTFLVVGASALAYALIDRSVHGAWFDYFYVGTEMNLPTWWNVLLLAGVGLAAAFAAAVVPKERVGWWAIAAAAAFLSLDEGSRLHETTGHLVQGFGIPTFSWVLVGAVVAPIGLIVLAVLTRHLLRGTRLALTACVAAYVVAALGLEAVGGYLQQQDNWGGFLTLTHVEETLEMLACAFAIYAIVLRVVPIRIEKLAEPLGAPDTPAGGSAPEIRRDGGHQHVSIDDRRRVESRAR